MTPDFIFNIRQNADLDWDIETFPNIFTAYFEDSLTEQTWYFEISPWRNDLALLCYFIQYCSVNGNRWVGFNSLNFDYPVVHFMYKNQHACIGVTDIYNKAMSIINADFNARFAHIVWENDHVVPQIDLFKIHHFDNMAKSTSLKVLEFNMQADRVEDLPFDVGLELNKEQGAVLGWYNGIDVKETKRFHWFSLPAIKMREELSVTFGQNMMNKSDVKIGELILLHKLNEKGIKTEVWVNNRKKKIQTLRSQVVFNDIIFPYVSFEHPEFQLVLDKLRNTTLTAAQIKDETKSSKLETKGVFKNLVANIHGMKYKFGTGGLHASVDNRIVRTSNTHQLVDVDVASYYPNLAIKNGLYPEHLGPEFCDAYHDVYETRKTFKKGTPENEAYKLALNGAYGNSNNDYSSLKDSQYTMSITINGQLLLAMFIEQLVKIPGLEMIQANTDGVSYLCPREYIDHTLTLIDWWQNMTKLELEEAHYDAMFVRDVNSYIAVKEDGKVKRIGAYAHETAATNPGTRELPWHKDWSFRIVPIAAEAHLVTGADLRKFITGYQDAYAFFGRTKSPRSHRVVWGGDRVPNIVRYFVSTTGKKLEKIMPATGPIGQYKRANKLADDFYEAVLAEIGPGVWDERIHFKTKSVYDERVTGICSGWNVEIMNKMEPGLEPDDIDIDYEFYIKETEKLINLLEK